MNYVYNPPATSRNLFFTATRRSGVQVKIKDYRGSAVKRQGTRRIADELDWSPVDYRVID